ncbi:MAG TPA: alpha-amylase family protein [Dermatophilaceae bacterium]|nr:alpha-amylase family protein [Dermatophilaceae bacterium]
MVARLRRSIRYAACAAAALVLAACTTGGAGAGAGGSAAPSALPKDTVVNLFQWTWQSVAAECPRLGKVGYSGVQISPPQEHVEAVGNPWWVDYQPVSYQLVSRRGDRAAFAAMVQACHAAGVKIYADAVINHMAGMDRGVGFGGSGFEHYTYPGIYQPQDFHHCGLTDGDDIRDYQSREQVQTCELVNLADLDTGSDYVRSRIAAYLNDLISLGVDGFRVDAVKHIPATDVAAIMGRLTTPVDRYYEVIDKGGEPITMGEYVGSGKVTVFSYGDQVGSAFQWGKIATLRELAGGVDGTVARVFLDNHDTQRHGGAQVLTHKQPRIYALATIFMLAWPYGEPIVMSSYEFTNPDAGPPALDDRGTTKDTVCGQDGWVCEHRWQSTEGMVGFHNVVKGTGVDRWWEDPSGNAVAFARGDRGYVVVNNATAPLAGRSFQSGMPPGTYCDVVHGALVDGRCTGPSVTVNADGWLTADVGQMDALAIHVGARSG